MLTPHTVVGLIGFALIITVCLVESIFSSRSV